MSSCLSHRASGWEHRWKHVPSGQRRLPILDIIDPRVEILVEMCPEFWAQVYRGAIDKAQIQGRVSRIKANADTARTSIDDSGIRDDSVAGISQVYSLSAVKGCWLTCTDQGRIELRPKGNKELIARV